MTHLDDDFLHVDVFTGIGGFALAALQVFGKRYKPICFCDIEPYAQELLKLRFPGVPIYDDIRKLTAERITADTDKRQQAVKEQQTAGHKQRDRELIQANGLNTDTNSDRRTGRKQGKHTAKAGEQAQHGVKRRIDLLTGGFPCQPFSMAGKRKGTQDDRYLWPEMLRVIKEFGPTWIIGENVAGILTMAQHESDIDLEGETDNEGAESADGGTNGVVWAIIDDLEKIGYEVQPFIIPACAVNAPHRRDRIWIVAHAKDSGYRGRSGQECGIEKRFIQQDEQEGNKAWGKGQGRDRGVASNNNNKGLQGATKAGNIESKRQNRTEQLTGQTGWTENWITVAIRTCLRGVDDGLPAILDGFKLSKAGHRVARLKGLGNAIVSQVAVELMRSIKSAEGL